MAYTLEQQKQHRKELVEALRSGKYEQTHSVLYEGNNSYCCLGVACEISGLDEFKIINSNNEHYYFDKSGLLPEKVMDYYGFKDREGMFCLYNSYYRLTSLNDTGFTFDQIADIIEYEPKGLFHVSV
jgi:hypothetical protein